MAVIKHEGNVLWFFTGKDSDKAREIRSHSQVNVAFADESHNKYVSLSGRAQVIEDAVKAKELWTVFAKGWFDGPDDPDLRIIRFEMDSAEYWDAPSSKMVYLFNLLRSAVTGSEVGMGENEEVEIIQSGSVFEAGEIIMKPMRELVLEHCPKAKLIRLDGPPVVGAVIFGMEQVGFDGYAIRENIIRTAKELVQ